MCDEKCSTMQLIFETENPNVHLKEKMSTLDEKTLSLTEKLSNRDVREVNGNQTTNSTDDEDAVVNSNGTSKKNDNMIKPEEENVEEDDTATKETVPPTEVVEEEVTQSEVSDNKNETDSPSDDHKELVSSAEDIKETAEPVEEIKEKESSGKETMELISENSKVSTMSEEEVKGENSTNEEAKETITPTEIIKEPFSSAEEVLETELNTEELPNEDNSIDGNEDIPCKDILEDADSPKEVPENNSTDDANIEDPQESKMDVDEELENKNLEEGLIPQQDAKCDTMDIDDDNQVSATNENKDDSEVNDDISALVNNIANDLDEDFNTDDLDDLKEDSEIAIDEATPAKELCVNDSNDKQKEESRETLFNKETELTQELKEDPVLNVNSENTPNNTNLETEKNKEAIGCVGEKDDTIKALDRTKDFKLAENIESTKTESKIRETKETLIEEVGKNVKETDKLDECTEAESDVIKISDQTDSERESDVVTVKFSESETNVVDSVNISVAIENKDNTTVVNISETEKSIASVVAEDEIVDLDDIKSLEEKSDSGPEVEEVKSPKKPEKTTPLIKLSNTMDILSDDEDKPEEQAEKDVPKQTEKQCINLDDDDDIMLIDEDTSMKDKKNESASENTEKKVENDQKPEDGVVDLDNVKEHEDSKVPEATDVNTDTLQDKITEELSKPSNGPDKVIDAPAKAEQPKPLIPEDFFKTYRKNLTDMTRDDLEEFCILKIVESIIDRSNLNEIRTKLKTMAQNIEEYKKKAMMLTKQNRDLQVVLKSVQEEQKKKTDLPIAPLKITRSVGMQVLMTERNRKRNVPIPTPPSTNISQVNNTNTNNTRITRNTSLASKASKAVAPQQIPVPKLVPAALNNQQNKVNVNAQASNNAPKSSPAMNGMKVPVIASKAPEKRPHSRIQAQQSNPVASTSSVTVDLTDDEPPTKVATKTPLVPPVRLVYQQNILSPRQPFQQPSGSPRKVFIPINGQGQVRNQAIMLKPVPTGAPRGKGISQSMIRVPQNALPMRRLQGGSRHPAPLPDIMKQYQPPNWKALPPAPDLKLSKVENGIVISWKIDGYQEDSYEEIASYQLYAYQETSAPPSTALWKKIGDVKALPLPMACTLTQFMAGYKYYFAVRAVDIRSRLGPFSLPGSILLLNKM